MKTSLLGVSKIECKRTIDRRRDWYESLAVIHDPKEKKAQRRQRMIVRSLNPPSSTKPASFEVRLSKSRCRCRFALRCFVFVYVQLQLGQAAAQRQRKKAVIRDISGVATFGHPGVTNLSAPIWFTGERHCTVFRSMMQLSLLVFVRKAL